MALLPLIVMTIFILVPAAAHAQVSSIDTARPSQQRSEAELKALLATRPSDLAPYVELAQLYNKSGRRDEGERILRQALTVHADSGAVFEALTSLFSSNPRDPEKLLAISEEWTKADPSNSKPLTLAAQVYMSRAANMTGPESWVHYDRALQALDDAIRQSPDDPTPRGMRLAVMGAKAKATDNPEERARLLREMEIATQEATKMTGGPGGRALPPTPAPPARPDEVRSKYPNAVRVGGNVRAPVKTKDVRPQYPAAALESRVQGVVIAEIVIDESGRVRDVRVLRSIPALDEAALEAVRQWEFTPTNVGGTVVPVIMVVTVQFTLPPEV